MRRVIVDSVNTIPKVVLSSTLHSAPWGDFPEARLLRGPALDEVARLKQGEGKDIMVWGSFSVAACSPKARTPSGSG